jgi:hypothetical protein
LTEEEVRRYARQILLAPIGGSGQVRLAQGSILLHGDAPLCATYLAAAGLGRLIVTGAPPALAARDPASFRLESGPPDAAAAVVLDLHDGAAFHAARGRRLWGAAHGRRVLCGREPVPGPPADRSARAVLETLAAGEALLLLLGREPHAYDFEV